MRLSQEYENASKTVALGTTCSLTPVRNCCEGSVIRSKRQQETSLSLSVTCWQSSTGTRLAEVMSFAESQHQHLRVDQRKITLKLRVSS